MPFTSLPWHKWRYTLSSIQLNISIAPTFVLRQLAGGLLNHIPAGRSICAGLLHPLASDGLGASTSDTLASWLSFNTFNVGALYIMRSANVWPVPKAFLETIIKISWDLGIRYLVAFRPQAIVLDNSSGQRKTPKLPIAWLWPLVTRLSPPQSPLSIICLGLVSDLIFHADCCWAVLCCWTASRDKLTSLHSQIECWCCCSLINEHSFVVFEVHKALSIEPMVLYGNSDRCQTLRRASFDLILVHGLCVSSRYSDPFYTSLLCLKGQSRLVLAQESADLHKDHQCHRVNILDDVIIAKLLCWLWCHSMVM